MLKNNNIVNYTGCSNPYSWHGYRLLTTFLKDPTTSEVFMTTRRDFLATMSIPLALTARNVPGAQSSFSPDAMETLSSLARYNGSAQEVAQNEDFWFEVSRAFTVDRSLVNLNNGHVSPSPGFVQDAMKRHLDYSHQAPAYSMIQILQPQKEGVRKRMAMEWNVDPEEVAFTRNSSESLQICQLGYDLNPGDEVLTTTQDYGRMLTTFRQRELREGIVLRQFDIPVPADDPETIVELFEANITPKTRLILMCHMINLTGQILPVKAVTTMARKYGIPVIVDGAHALAHFDFKIPDLGCDNYSVSLHKWLFAPHGTGLLYVKKESIKDIWPLMAANESQKDNIRKFEEIGTAPAANYLAIAEALTFHQGIGSKRKEARLVYLRNYWADQLLKNDRIRIHTSLQPGKAAGIANVEIIGQDSAQLKEWLWNEHKIISVAINHPQFQGLRITPSVYTSLEELDRFVAAMEQVLSDGLSA
jgi:selenocysteine lyase/cysteine desulfurase